MPLVNVLSRTTLMLKSILSKSVNVQVINRDGEVSINPILNIVDVNCIILKVYSVFIVLKSIVLLFNVFNDVNTVY